MTIGFSTLSKSREILLRSSDSGEHLIHQWKKYVSALRHLRFCLLLNNWIIYGQTEPTAGFNALDRSGNDLLRSSDCSKNLVYWWEKDVWAEFLAAEIWNVLGCSSITSDVMDKWMLRADLTHQIGPQTTLPQILTLVQSGDRRRWKATNGNFLPQKLEMVSRLVPQPVMTW